MPQTDDPYNMQEGPPRKKPYDPNYPETRPRPARGLDPNRPFDLSAPAPRGVVAAPAPAPAPAMATPAYPLEASKLARRLPYGNIAPTQARAAAVKAASGTPGELIPGMTTQAGAPDGVASSIDAQGVRTYDNASIARVQRRNGEQAQGVSGQGFGGNQAADVGSYGFAAQEAQALDNATPDGSLRRTLRGDVQGAEVERKTRLDEITTTLAGIGPLNTRGKKDLFANLMAAKSGLTENRIKTANDFESQGTREENGAAQAQARLQGDVENNNADRREQGLTRRESAKAAADRITAENDPNSFANRAKADELGLKAEELGLQVSQRRDEAGAKRVASYQQAFMADGTMSAADALVAAQAKVSEDNVAVGRPQDSIDGQVGAASVSEQLAAETDPNSVANFFRSNRFTPNGVGLPNNVDPNQVKDLGAEKLFGLIPTGNQRIGYSDANGEYEDIITGNTAERLRKLRRSGP